MRRVLIVAAIGAYIALGAYDIFAGRLRVGVAEVLLGTVNTLLLL
jgi:hypothetical protein